MKFQNYTILAILLLCFKTSLAYNYSTDGKCGPSNGYRICPGNECCNKNGICGFDKNHCGTGCQSEFGYCLPSNYQSLSCSSCIGCVDCDKNPKNALLCPSTCKKKESYNSKLKISTDGNCGPDYGTVCPSEKCCSKYGHCGTKEKYCDISYGCQIGFGRCYEIISTKKTSTKKSTTTIKKSSTKKSSSSTKKSSTKKSSTKKSSTKKTTIIKTIVAKSTGYSNISTDGKCGPENGNKICPSNKCCSKYGYCGTSEKYCDTSFGCLSKYGR
eukprot:jgi/Orpsp1_1/1174414/evm.model.c7180000050008.1